MIYDVVNGDKSLTSFVAEECSRGLPFEKNIMPPVDLVRERSNVTRLNFDHEEKESTFVSGVTFRTTCALNRSWGDEGP